MNINELSLRDLENSSRRAFPHTRRRQHATGTIVIDQIKLTPFLGVKTLLCRARADNSADDGGTYRPLILLKGVAYGDDLSGHIKLTAEDGKDYFLRPCSFGASNALVRCQCADLYWRFHHYDHLASALYGSNRKPYNSSGVGSPANPLELPGYCKHLFKFSETLKHLGIVL